MSARRFLVVAAFLLTVLVVVGCGDSTPSKNTAPSEKQQEKEKMKVDAGTDKQKSK